MNLLNKNIFRLLGMLTIGVTLLITTGCQENNTDTPPASQEPPTDQPPGGEIPAPPVTDNTVSLSWTPPTTRSDGSQLTDLAGYRLYYGTSQGVYTDIVDIDNVGITEYVFDNLAPNTYFFAITAVDSQGVESIYSNEVSKKLG